MSRHIDQAIEFRTIMEQPIGDDSNDLANFQWCLIREEFGEFTSAESNSENELKELADLVYVCFQFAAAKGWDLDEALDRVHASNLSKLVDNKPVKNKAGKVIKGPNYQPPVLTDLL